MQIAIPQLNYKAGDLGGNTEKIITAIRKARKEGAELVVFPELSVCGALPQDLLEHEDFIDRCRLSVERIAAACDQIAAIVGAPNLDSQNGIMYNSAYFIRYGEVVDGVHKNILSDYDIFNESRYFIAGEDNTPIRYKNQNIRILFDEYEAEFIDPQDSFVIYMGMTPFTGDSASRKDRTLSAIARKYSKTIVAVDHCGGYTSVLFEGRSAVYNHKGQPVCRLSAFAEDFGMLDTRQTAHLPVQPLPATPEIAVLHQALIFGIRDYFSKHGFTKAILGLSGGIDSAVVAALATEALGASRVMGLLMPSGFSSEHSVTDAKQLAENLGIAYKIIPIGEIYDHYLTALHPSFGDLPFNVAEENLQARIRGMLVMAMSNKFGYIALNTSNKSEAAVGYGTLYGDLCGSLSILGDLYKTQVYQLAGYLNRDREIIPVHTITKAPSAELRPGQKDQDSLPAYDSLDAILKLYIEENRSASDIMAEGFPSETVGKVIAMVERNEYKRAQCPPILKVSGKTFGTGRKYPY